MGLVFFSGMAGFVLVFSLYTQLGPHYSPLKAGLAQIPWSIGMIAAFGAAQAVQRFGRRVIHAGTVIMAGGVIGIVVTLQAAGPAVTPWQLAPALVITGLGMGLLMAPFFDIVPAGVEPHETGSAGGTLTAIQQLGSAPGVALLGTIFFGMLGTPSAAHPDGGFGTAMTATLWIEVGMLALTFLVTFLLPLRARPEDQATTEPAPNP